MCVSFFFLQQVHGVNDGTEPSGRQIGGRLGELLESIRHGEPGNPPFCSCCTGMPPAAPLPIRAHGRLDRSPGAMPANWRCEVQGAADDEMGLLASFTRHRNVPIHRSLPIC
ncbi:hypothetical protein RJ55_01342 [Drechmeria coniospora]|nr:hypothetical protein RJ55_01342 [Drechmeria coniospora]